jgi:hypothetical protein
MGNGFDFSPMESRADFGSNAHNEMPGAWHLTPLALVTAESSGIARVAARRFAFQPKRNFPPTGVGD